jgi:hypothetical protein
VILVVVASKDSMVVVTRWVILVVVVVVLGCHGVSHLEVRRGDGTETPGISASRASADRVDAWGDQRECSQTLARRITDSFTRTHYEEGLWRGRAGGSGVARRV